MGKAEKERHTFERGNGNDSEVGYVSGATVAKWEVIREGFFMRGEGDGRRLRRLRVCLDAMYMYW